MIAKTHMFCPGQKMVYVWILFISPSFVFFHVFSHWSMNLYEHGMDLGKL